MAVKKMGLGKGLDSMIPPKRTSIPDNFSSEENAAKSGETILKINEVEPNKNQPRKNFNEEALRELSDSIKLHGIVQPLVVSKQNDYYEIIAGERRWRAAKMAGLKEIPVVIKDYSPQEIMEVALIENIQREDLNPVEEARAYQRLIKEYDLKQEEVAEKVSRSRTAITNSLRLLKLDERVLDMLVDERISSGHARALLGISDPDQQFEAAQKVEETNLSVRDTEKLVKSINNPAAKKPAKKQWAERIHNPLCHLALLHPSGIAGGAKIILLLQKILSHPFNRYSDYHYGKPEINNPKIRDSKRQVRNQGFNQQRQYPAVNPKQIQLPESKLVSHAGSHNHAKQCHE